MRSFLIRVLLVLCLGLTPGLARADVPHLINYQGRLSASGTPLTGDYTITFSLYDAPENGAAVWSETHDVTVTDGLFSVVLGSLAAFPNGFFSTHDELHLGIRVAGEAEMTPRQRLVSTPYAFRAESAETAESAEGVRAGAVGTAQLADGAVTTAKLAPGALVNSVNGASGAVSVEGSGGVSVTTAGNTITIAAQGGGGSAGVQAIQNSDNALTVTNPIGPTVTLDVRQGGISAGMLADDAVTSSAVADGGIEAVDLAESAAVKTVNGMAGAITISGEGGATVTSAGNTITINAGSGGGASGVQGIQNTDGFLQITNPNGPTVTVDVATGAVTSGMIRDGAVTGPKIANLGVTEEKIANSAITSAKIADGQIQAVDLSAQAAVRTLNTVSGDVTLAATGSATLARSGNTLTINVPPATTAGIRTIANSDGAISVTAPNGPTTTLGISSQGIQTNMIADDAVNGAKIDAGAVNSSHLASGSIGTIALADDAVTSPKLADDAVATTKVADDAVTSAKLADDAVTSAKILDAQVATADLQNGSVTAPKLGTGAVTAAAILDGTITTADLDPNAAVTRINGRDGNITVRGAGGTTVTTTGDTLVISGGLVSGGVSSVTSPKNTITVGSPNGPNVTVDVAAGAIDNTMLAADAVTSAAIAADAVGSSEIAADAVGSSEIASGAVGADEIADDGVGSAEIGTDAVGSSEIASGAVGTDEIADGSVTGADLAPNSVSAAQIADGSIGTADLATNAFVTDIAGLRGSITVTGGGGIQVTSIPPLNEIRISDASSSSIRWKKDVETIDGALGIVEQLRGVRYTWKETGVEDIGFIAEEVGQVLPEIVTWEENGVDAQGVVYARVVSVLVEAVKEQQRQIEEQQQTLTQFAERLARLEEQAGQSSAAASIR